MTVMRRHAKTLPMSGDIILDVEGREAQDAADSVRRDDERVRQYVEERRDSIERGARRSRARFRL